jgi:homoserine dehydrogenase
MITVALLGRGTVGGGVHELLERSGRYRISGIARRNDDPVRLAASGANVVVELMGGMEPAHAAMRAALFAGAHVVTANKAVIAAHGETLEALAASRGVRLLYSAAVGGGVPVLARVRQVAGRVTRVDAVLNGTTNFVLDRLAEGMAWADAIAEAQRRGFAEADPSLDLNGTDAAQKITIVARTAFGCAPERVTVRGIAPGTRGRLVASTWREGERVLAAVRPRLLRPSHPLAKARDEENVVVIHHEGGRMTLWGKGAGRWPTAGAVMADIETLSNVLERPAVERVVVGAHTVPELVP